MSLGVYFAEKNIDPQAIPKGAPRNPFDADYCAAVEDVRPAVVSFHFGLPEHALLERVKKAGALVLASATTVEEARWLEEHGADVVIAQGNEAGGPSWDVPDERYRRAARAVCPLCRKSGTLFASRSSRPAGSRMREAFGRPSHWALTRCRSVRPTCERRRRRLRRFIVRLWRKRATTAPD